MSDTQRDREERQRVIEILQKEKRTALHDNKWAFDYAIASIKTDLKYDLLYEETSGQADKPTTKDNLGVDYLGVDCISREQALRELKESAEHHANDSREETLLRRDRDIIRALPPASPQEPRWIPVSERLPKVADCYAVTEQIGSDLIVKACYFDGRNNWHDDNWINDERNYLTDIVAWMPLPEPYKAESEG